MKVVKVEQSGQIEYFVKNFSRETLKKLILLENKNQYLFSHYFLRDIFDIQDFINSELDVDIKKSILQNYDSHGRSFLFYLPRMNDIHAILCFFKNNFDKDSIMKILLKKNVDGQLFWHNIRGTYRLGIILNFLESNFDKKLIMEILTSTDNIGDTLLTIPSENFKFYNKFDFENNLYLLETYVKSGVPQDILLQKNLQGRNILHKIKTFNELKLILGKIQEIFGEETLIKELNSIDCG
jgi:hypothetical protein